MSPRPAGSWQGLRGRERLQGRRPGQFPEQQRCRSRSRISLTFLKLLGSGIQVRLGRRYGSRRSNLTTRVRFFQAVTKAVESKEKDDAVNRWVRTSWGFSAST